MHRDRVAAPLASVDLNLLVALDALLQERSVTRAGRRLGLTQSATSAALARLRDLFGDELLVRRGREMQPTALADALETPVREALSALEHVLRTRSSFDSAHDARVFTIATTDYTTLVLLPGLIERLRHAAPQVRLRIKSLDTGSSLARLERGEIDLAIISAFFDGGSDLMSTPVFSDRFVAAMWRHAPDIPDVLTEEELRRRPFLSYRVGEILPMAERRLSELGLRLDPSLVIDNFTTGAHLLRGTDMVGFLQRRAALVLQAGAELCIIDTALDLPRLVETMWWHQRSDDDAAHHWLREQVLAAAAQLPD